MNKNLFALALCALLLGSVMVGVMIAGPAATGADRPVDQPKVESQKSLPRFDCEEGSESPYEMSDADRDEHVGWFEETFAMNPAQTDSMDTVFVEASQRADEFWSEARLDYCELRRQFFEDIRGVLDSDQLVELERIIAERRRKHEGAEPLRVNADSSEKDSGLGKRP